MIELIIQIIAACMVCQQFERARIYDHPAKALPILGLFDRVGIDLVFGLPLTLEGFKGILLITDYLSKYPFAFCIKSKQAIEIATRFFEFISYFGPPNFLLSDCGTEFLNNLVHNVSLICGIERKVTVAYHPQTNGLTEKFNDSFINALRKHTVAHPEDWDQWLPYILLAFRTRVHTTTGLTPIELVTGKKANSFESWSCDDQEFEHALLDRSKQLRNLVDNVRPNNTSTISKKQTVQMKR